MKKTSKKGFTLVEIVVVLVILAIMAGFAVPAYNGFVTKAKQSEVLADARIVLVAAQAAGQEKYAIKGSALTNAADNATVKASIDSYLGTIGGFYTATLSGTGVVTGILYQKAGTLATFASGSWTVGSGAAPVASTVVLP